MGSASSSLWGYCVLKRANPGEGWERLELVRVGGAGRRNKQALLD